MAIINKPRMSGGGDPLGKLMQVGGAVAGGMAGGFPGAMAGAQAGGMLHGLMPQQAQAEVPEVGSAMSRRQAQLDQTPLRQIRESIDALKFVQDDKQRMELAAPLLQAQFAARKGMA